MFLKQNSNFHKKNDIIFFYKEWDWTIVSSNKNIGMKYINDNPHLPWDWYEISSNKNITLKDINDNPDNPCDWNLFYII